MANFYIMTPWGPMRTCRGHGNSSENVTALKQQLNELQSKFNAVVEGEGDTTSAIDTVPEILEFLKENNNTQTLQTGINDATVEDINTLDFIN